VDHLVNNVAPVRYPEQLENAKAHVIELVASREEVGMPERPGELIYALDETPPWPHLLALGFQHVAVICPYLVMVALVAEAAKLPHDAAQSAIGLAMIAVAFMTVLQSLRLGPVGSGYLCPPVVSAIYLPSSLAAASSFGFSAVCGMVIFAGVCEIAVASLINRTRKLFPAVVSGVVIIAVGLELGKIGASVLLEHAAAHSGQTTASFVTAACALAAMTGLAVWATGLPKLFCSLIGILVGYAAAAALHVFPPSFFADYLAARFFAIPDPSFLSYAFAPSLAAPFAIAGLASGLRVIGVLTTCKRTHGAHRCVYSHAVNCLGLLRLLIAFGCGPIADPPEAIRGARRLSANPTTPPPLRFELIEPSFKRCSWVGRDAMRLAIEFALDRVIKEVARRRRCQKARDCRRINFAIVVPSAAQFYQHVGIFLVIADPLDEAASADRVAFERSKINWPTVFYICNLMLLSRNRGGLQCELSPGVVAPRG